MNEPTPISGGTAPDQPTRLEKFSDPDWTADGSRRASVPVTRLETLWFNTGTLCNIECVNCYIESSPTNDRLVYLTLDEVTPYLDEIAELGLGTREIGFTGGEPFMNPHMTAMAEAALSRGFEILILTNAMRPMMRPNVRRALADMVERYGDQLTVRVSIDHFEAEMNDKERGEGVFAKTLEGLKWLQQTGARYTLAGRTMWEGLDEAAMRAGFAKLFAEEGLRLDASDPAQLVLFPEMDGGGEPPEITTACWGILGKSPDSIMCATSRMVVKRKGAETPVVLSCTLIPYEAAFEMGATLSEALAPVKLNHRHCATFCVLGGASCS